jgi:DNA-binding MarR family transcriptional regulator
VTEARAASPSVLRPEASNDAPPAELFLGAFDAFVQAVRRARGASSLERARGLTLSQYGVLQPLAASADGARVSELAAHAGIAPPTATRILDALERRGIVERKRAVDDRRGVSVTLTPFGREVLCSEDEWLRSRQREFYASMPDEERMFVPDLLLRLAGLIDEMAGGP